MTEQILQAIVNGILIGGVYAVLAVGLALVFGVMEIVNFAQSEFVMLGMYIAYAVFAAVGLDPIAAVPIVFLAVFAFGAAVQRLLIQPVLRAPMVSQIFLTVGLSFVLVAGAQLLFGATFLSVVTPYQTAALTFGGLQVSVPYLLAFLASAVMAALLWAFLERTDMGRAMRATSQNRTAAQLMGINPTRIYMIAFGLGTGLAGVAGAVILPYAYVFPTVGHNYSLVMFTVVTLGGLGSVSGAVVGGLVVGVIHAVSAVFLPTQLQNVVVFAIFLATLLFRPSGLLGAKA
ncbi:MULTISPECIES: branched-chain amino acid ABC transporter permease [unclassified Xanthobacter]|uniref:branched-chain amino acid ABC transporter permease n=1 Tax=unclassified Xanthobacter TaxID=2623496 RepID=UPI001EE0C3E6|nr:MULTISPECIES: branched-chain amino acid ABC transporter permease [unclassified Xanthobacter]